MSIQCISLLISHTCSSQRREEHGRATKRWDSEAEVGMTE